MFQISDIDFLIDTHPRERDELEKYAVTLFERYESLLNISIRLDDYAIEFDLENGSLSGKGKVWAAIGGVYVFISGYGGFSSGVETMASHAKAIGRLLAEEAPQLIGEHSAKTIKHRSSAAQLGDLERSFRKVREGQITPETAAALAIELFKQSGEELPSGLKEGIQNSFGNLQLNPVQQSIVFEDENVELLSQEMHKDRHPDKPRQNRAQLAMVNTNRLRVVVRREGKNKDRQVTFIEHSHRMRKQPKT